MLSEDKLRTIEAYKAHIKKCLESVRWYHEGIEKYQRDAAENPEDNERYKRIIRDYQRYAEDHQRYADKTGLRLTAIGANTNADG